MIWFLVCWFTLVGLVCAVLGGFYLYDHVDEGIRTQVERYLSQMYPNFGVKVAGAKLVEREGFEIRGVSFRSPSNDEPFLFVDEILVRCRPSLDDLLNKNPKVQEIVVRHAKMLAAQDRHGKWNYAELFRLPPSEVTMPRVQLENGTIQIEGREGSNLELRNLYAKIEADVEDPNQVQVDAAFTGNHLQRFIAHGNFDRTQPKWNVSGSITDAAISPELQSALPPGLAVYVSPLSGLEARTHVEFEVRKDPRLYPTIQFQVNGKIAEGRWTHSTLAFPVTDLTGKFQLTQNHQRLEGVTGRYGDAAIVLSAQRDGVAIQSPIQVRGKVTRLRLERNMVAQLPSQWQEEWNHFQPLGLIDSEFQLDFNHGRWVPQADVHCRDVSFLWDKHPYPIEHAAGEIAFRSGRCTFELHSINEKQPIRFVGDVNHLGKRWTGWVESFVDKPIPLDERVLSAMSSRAQSVIRPFSPRGTLTMFARIERKDPSREPYHRMVVDLHDGAIRHDKFPYPLQNVSARFERQGHDWRFTNIVGENDGAILKCEGDWQGTVAGAGNLRLRFTGSDLPLEEELRLALSPTAQHLWDQLQPQGTLDNVAATLNYSLPGGEKQLVVRAGKLPDRQSRRAHSLSVNPTTFPYRIDNVSGTVTISNDRLQIEKLRGNHGKVAITTSGVAKVSRDGPWSMTFSPVTVDRLRVDDELANALPRKMRKMLSQVPFSGPISLGGSLQLAGNARNPSATRAAWDLDVDLENGRLNFEVPLEHISGSMHLDGRSDANQSHCRGELNIDSMICKGVQLSNVRGPLWVDRNRIVLGKRARPAQPGLPPQRLTAGLFGGKLGADVEMLLDRDGKFKVSATLASARAIDLTQRFCNAQMSGQAWANVNLTGNSHGPHTWAGNGTVQLRNTNLYELPVVLSLLRTIRTGSSDRTAFNSSNIAFHLKGKHVYFDQLDLLGDTLTLKGVGEMDMKRQLDLNFYTVMGREDSYLPAIRPLLGMASRRFLMVRVSGNANDPTMSREVLPGLNDTLKQLFPETNSPGDLDEPEIQLATGIEPLQSDSNSPVAQAKKEKSTVRR